MQSLGVLDHRPPPGDRHLIERKEFQSAREVLEDGIRWSKTGRSGLFRSLFRALRAEALHGLDQPEKALKELEGALDDAHRSPQVWWEPEMRRCRANVLCAESTRNAEKACLKAIAVAAEQNSNTFRLRAANQLARMYLAQGRAMDARSVLGPLYAELSGSPNLPEVEEAQAILGGLH